MRPTKIVPILFLLVLALSFSGCEEVVDSEVTKATEPRLVVDALFTNEVKAHTVKLSRSVPLNTKEPAPTVSGALILLTDGTHTYPLVESKKAAGTYQTETTVKGEVGQTYTLTVQVGGQTYTASETMEPVPTLTPLAGYRPEAGNTGFYLWDIPNDNSVGAGTSYEWHIILTPPPGGVLKEEAEFVYYNFTGLETSALFKLNEMSQTLRFQGGTTVTQKKHSLSPQYYAFLKAIYAETDWKGGLYDTTPANAPTNLNNGAAGFFRVSAAATLSQVVE